ncbi:MAG: leucine-rich repeat domain-containing protein [Bacteroidetes bacterium]|nr:leucine-rich repeat domain-containing protein [Bacteroidota bacterium]
MATNLLTLLMNQASKKLNLSQNRFNLTGVDFSQFSEVEELDLSNCRISELPKGIEYMPRLKKLNLSGNKKLNMSKTLFKLSELKSLRELNISGCGIVELPAEIYHLRSLKQLNLDHNPINSLSANTVRQLPESLEFYSCVGCRFQEISNAIKALPRLNKIMLDHEVYDDLVRINLYNKNVQLMVA